MFLCVLSGLDEYLGQRLKLWLFCYSLNESLKLTVDLDNLKNPLKSIICNCEKGDQWLRPSAAQIVHL